MKVQESAFEAGVLLLGLGIAAAVGVLIAGRTLSSGQGRLRRAERRPEPGSVKAERHQHISTVAAR